MDDNTNPLTPAQQRAWDEFSLALTTYHEERRTQRVEHESAATLRSQEASWAKQGTPEPGPDLGQVLTPPRKPAKVLFLAHYRKPTLREWVRNIYADFYLQLDHPGFLAGGSKTWR